MIRKPKRNKSFEQAAFDWGKCSIDIVEKKMKIQVRTELESIQ
jgi:hypothetical protein